MKRGQLDLSFGLIFSVILIIAFLGFGVYAIVNFLGMKDKIETSKFLDDFQANVNTLWKANIASEELSYFLPVKIKEVCFVDKNADKKGSRADIYDEIIIRSDDKSNLVFYPIGSSKAVGFIEIQHINISKITAQNNPACLQNKNGKLSVTLEKGYGETLVNVKK